MPNIASKFLENDICCCKCSKETLIICNATVAQSVCSKRTRFRNNNKKKHNCLLLICGENNSGKDAESSIYQHKYIPMPLELAKL